MRLDRPVGIWLYLLPALWSMFIVTPQRPVGELLVPFTLSAVLIRGAGCAANDLADRKLDAEVARTRHRPLAAGDLTVREAMVFGLLQMAAALVVLGSVSPAAAAVMFVSVPLIVAYPYMKRVTYWPQAWLGMTFNTFGLAACVAATGRVTVSAMLLYAAGLLWTVGYDTVYAHQDKVDDVAVGIKSTALLLRDYSRFFVASCYTGTVLLILAAGRVERFPWPFWVAMVPAVAQLVWQLGKWNMQDPDDCREKFVSNQIFGLLVLIAILIGRHIAVA
ncbi:MAG: 4-hydroxybenzoate octaprenyltransferase [Mycobacteriaceae bacterium]|nr:4-hydroxybenzoate octaprenyltransferase [Mycobacteriaceae bacterium]